MYGQRLRVREFYERQGVVFKRESDGELIADCPFCSDRKAHFYVRASDGVYWCHKCHARGNPTKFLRQHGKLNGDNLHQELERYGFARPKPRTTKPKTFAWALVEHYEKAVSPEQIAELAQARGIPEELLRKYHLGWDGKAYALPLQDALGKLVGVIRKLPAETILKRGSQAGLFGVEGVRDAEQVLLCEGPWDKLVAEVNGFTSVGVTGAGTFKDEWGEWFRGKRVAICYDCDEAGRKGSERAAERLLAVCDEVKIINLGPERTDGFDLSDYFRDGGTAEELRQRIEQTPRFEKRDPIVERIQDVRKGDLDALRPIYRQIAYCDPIAQEKYCRLIHEVHGIPGSASKRQIRLEAEKQIGQASEGRIQQTTFEELEDGRIVELGYDPGARKVFFLVYDPATDSVTHHERLQVGDLVYVPPGKGDGTPDNLVSTGAVLLPSGADDYETESKLVEEIKEFIHRYVELDPLYEGLCAYYVLFTYVYDRFDTVPYLRVVGDYGTGKTRFIKVMKALCYRSTCIAGALTSASIFRMIERYKGTLIIDEGDLHDRTDLYHEVVKILNCGIQRDTPVIRVSGENGSYEPEAFQVFGPKVLATRKKFKDRAFESRLITHAIQPRTREDVPINLDEEEFNAQAAEIRKKLAMFRFRKRAQAKLNREVYVSGVEDRLNQVMAPLASIIDDPDVLAQMKGFVRGYQQEVIEDRQLTLAAEVAEIAVASWEKSGTGMQVKAIASELNECHCNGEGADWKDRISAQKVGRLIRDELGLRTKKHPDGKFLELAEGTVQQLRRKYGIGSDDAKNVDDQNEPPF